MVILIEDELNNKENSGELRLKMEEISKEEIEWTIT